MRVLQRYSDLLPDIKIEAQRADDITMLSALRRNVETLAKTEGFFKKDYVLTIKRMTKNGRDLVLVNLPGAVIRINGVVATSENEECDLHLWECDLHRNTLHISDFIDTYNMVRVECDIIPDIDEELNDTKMFSRYRNLIVAVTLKDLLSMEGRSWFNPTRANYFAMEARTLFEDFKRDQLTHGDGVHALDARNPVRWC